MFEGGQIYRRRDLHAQFGGQNQGGISTPSSHPMILIFTGDTGAQYGYHDGWDEDGSFRYTGEGQVDDFAGIPVLVSAKMQQNLNADGLYDGVTTNTTGFALVYRPDFSNADRQAVELNEDDTPKENLQIKVLADARFDFKPNFKLATEPIVVYGYGIPVS